MMTAIVILLALLSNPIISVTPEGDFLVTYDPGATWACTVYELQDADPPYAPRHCWVLDERDDSYIDDWDFILKEDADWLVWAEIGYLKEGEIEYVETNRVVVHR